MALNAKSVLINQIVSPTFCLCFASTGINFRGMLHHVCDAAYDENVSGLIRTRICRSTNRLINYMLSIIHLIRHCVVKGKGK